MQKYIFTVNLDEKYFKKSNMMYSREANTQLKMST